MSVEEFIDQIAGKGLLDETLLQRLRRDATVEGNQWTPQDVIKFLVDQGHLTRFQGKNLLKEAQTAQAPAHDTLDLAASESIDGLSIGVVDDDDDDDDEIIDLEAAMPATVTNQTSAETLDDVVDLSQANALENGDQQVPQTVPTQPMPTMPGPAQTGTMEMEVAEDSAGFAYEEIPTTLLDKQFNNQIWDRRFLYATMVVLLIFVGGGGVFYFVINNKSADAKFEAALAEYNQSNYQAAQQSMQEFADMFPADEKANDAWALFYLSRIHLQVQSQEGTAIEEITAAITTGKDIPGFSSKARDELKVVLPNFTKVFLGRAEATSILVDKRDNYELAVRALELIDLPGALGTTRSEPAVRTELEAIDERMATVKRHIDRDSHLKHALEEMSVAVSSGAVARAFDSRAVLLALYPELQGDERLFSSLQRMIDTERVLVKKVSPTWQPQAAPSASGKGPAVTSSTTGQSIAGVEGQLAVLAGGNVVGLTIADGKVVWQHFVGLQTTLAPTQVGSLTVFVNEVTSEISAVENSSGTLRWRLAVDGRITSLSSQSDTAVVTMVGENGGTLLVLDGSNGNVRTQIHTSIGLSTAPAFNTDASVVYIVGEHSFVYAIALADGKCLDIYSQNHGVGSIAYPPVFAEGYVVVAQDLDAEVGLVTLKHEGLGELAESGEVLRVPGMLSSALKVVGDRLLVTTDVGELRLFEVAPQNNLADSVLQPLAATTLAGKQPARHFNEMSVDSVSVGSTGITNYAITEDGQLNRLSQIYPGDVVVASSQEISSVVIAQRKRVGVSSVTVSGAAGSDVPPSWETELSALADSVIVAQGDTAVTVDAIAQVFDVKVGGNSESETSLNSGLGYSHAIAIGDKLVLQSLTGSTDFLVFDTVAAGTTPANIQLQGLIGQPAGPGGSFRGRLLLPVSDGQLALFDVTTGKQSLVAYHPVKQPGEVVRWSDFALPSDNANTFLVIRDRKSLQKIGINALPVPHLELVGEMFFDAPVYNQVAATGETAYLIRRGRDNDEIVGVSYDKLDERSSQEVSGRVVWGPYRLGNIVLVYTSGSRLYGFGPQQELLWRSDQQVDLTPVGGGLQIGDQILVTGLDGTLWRVNAADGTTISEVNLNKRVIGTPFVVSEEVWIPTESGVLSGTVLE